MYNNLIPTFLYFETAQNATQLVITTKANIKPRQNANFPIEGYIVIEAQDANGRRVYSGPDSTLVRHKSTSINGYDLSDTV